MITQKINLNLIPNGVMPRVNVSQYDYGSRTLEITLYNGASLFTIPTGANVVIQGTKKDNRGFQYSNLDFSGSVVTADITQQMTVFEDEVHVELVIITGSGDNTQQLATANFILNVEPAALKDDIVVSETDIPAIQTLPEAMAEVEAAVELIETALPAIEGAEAWAVGTKDGVPVTSEDEQYHNNSKYYAEQASTSETNAGLSAGAASGSATAASGSAEDAEAYGVGKRGGVDVTSGDVAYQNNSKYYAGLASNSANNASTSETNAGLSESAARGSATNASNNADQAEAWATGEINGTPVASDKPQYHNSAKYWAEQAEHAAGGGVTSFNGRSGSVSPADGDYDITQIAPISGATEGQVVVVDPNGDFTVGNAPSGGHTIENGTTTFTQRSNLKFTGNVSVSDDSTNNATVVEVTDSGHEIINASGTSMTQRTGLQFATGFSVKDDSINDKTVVNAEPLASNENLLDNPWFTVNQRGQSSYVITGEWAHTLDNWQLLNDKGATSTLDVNSDGSVTLTNTNPTSTSYVYIRNKFEDYICKSLIGKQVTFSIKTNTGIYSKTWVPVAGSESRIDLPNGWFFALITYPHLGVNENYVRVWSGANVATPITIYAVKLEVGSVSTLEQDSAPNYAEELLKCQRYYQVLEGWHYLALKGSGGSQMTQWGYHTRMRVVPVVTIVSGVNETQITSVPTVDSVLLYKNGDTTTELGVFKITLDANL